MCLYLQVEAAEADCIFVPVCVHINMWGEQERSACHCVIERIVHSVKNHVSNEHLYPRHRVSYSWVPPSLQSTGEFKLSEHNYQQLLNTQVFFALRWNTHPCLDAIITILGLIIGSLGGDCWNYLNERKYKDVDKLEGQMCCSGHHKSLGPEWGKVSVFYLLPSLPQGNEHISKNNNVAQLCRLHLRLYKDSQQSKTADHVCTLPLWLCWSYNRLCCRDTGSRSGLNTQL